MILRTFWLTASLICLGLGLIGLVIPVLPGIPLLAAAILCFTLASPSTQRTIQRHRLWRHWQQSWQSTRTAGLRPRVRLLREHARSAINEHRQRR